MSRFSDLIKGLKHKVFGSEEQQQAPVVTDHTRTKKAFSANPQLSDAAGQPPSDNKPVQPTTKRDLPHFVQIGFDFGTAYSKCVCRDIITNKAWIHLPSGSADKELPFLIPSTLVIEKDRFLSLANTGAHYPDNGLFHLKLALEKIALGQLSDPVLDPYRRVCGESNAHRLASFVKAGAIYFLAGALGDVRRSVRKRIADFGDHPDDYMAVNLAVPVADAERPEVNNLYHQVLCHSWFLADQLAGHPAIPFDKLESLLDTTRGNVDDGVREACFIYPEVSANVQGFVRSRASSEGIYLFSDAGAGTVDQSIFIFNRNGHNEHLVYLHGSVLPLGSSCIERYAAESSDHGYDWTQLERLRKEKENGGQSLALEDARSRLAKELDRGTTRTLALARKKLFRREQITESRVIFGGGGHCKNPYEVAAISPFSGNLFAQTINPDVVGLPTPMDLDIRPEESRWLPRVSVAYGLSFEKSELAKFTYPVDIQPPEPPDLWDPPPTIPDAPSKDVC